ncbi:MAG TPA: DUF418 domain-containing protein [Burkholderiaceae bacterium]|nr:DUF418 domain-containing protein [Burkholderiaceae bacterium]
MVDLYANAVQPRRRTRLELIDALRAFALIGILQVNVQSYLWGAGDPLGFFVETPRTADILTWFVLDTWMVGKFMPLFALLLGFSMALQWRSVRRAWRGLPHAIELTRQVMRRRFRVLLLLGVAHGGLLYYGDILTAYALCALVALRYMPMRPARLMRAVRNWGGAYLALIVLVLGYAIALHQHFGADGADYLLPIESVEAFSIYVAAPYFEQLQQRMQDYRDVLSGTLLIALPFIVSLFLLGALAARLGWLHHPERHPKVWRVALYVGLLGWLLAAVGAGLNTRTMLNAPSNPDPTGALLLSLSSTTTALYLALIVRWRDAPWMRAVIRWLAPIGRMPLTNYLMQSLFMGLVLSGWGLGLGTQLRQVELVLVAAVITLWQVFASRAWMARFGQGPMEALWRWMTYGVRPSFGKASVA